jgi:Tfp pilus assembly protein PilF
VHLRKAVQLKPDLPNSHAALARALLAEGKKDEAEQHYREALRLLEAADRSSTAETSSAP